MRVKESELATPRPQTPDDTRATRDLLRQLRSIVGSRHVITGHAATRQYRTGYRFGSGPAIAVVKPGRLVEQWRILQACAAADVIVIMQAANTGLTGGSTPDGDAYDRDIVIVNTLRMSGFQVIDEGRQVICLPGTRLYDLERGLRPLGREPHSVIGSSCIGASVLGGVCNNSGGSLVQRGPAYTEMALFARLDDTGAPQLVNHLGIRLGGEPEEILRRLDASDYDLGDIEFDPQRRASDRDYLRHVREIDADTPARFNADPRRLFEASGSAGKLMLFAVRLDTFPAESTSRVFYIGANKTSDLTAIRRDILGGFETPPVSGEYIHRTAFEIADIYGKDVFLAIQHLGSDRLLQLFGLKARIDTWTSRFSILKTGLSDRLLQRLSGLFPEHLPARILSFHNRYEHHLILKMADGGIDEARAYLAARLPSASADYFECTEEEGAKAFMHRFAVAGAAVRYRAVHPDQVEDIVALDIALPRNEQEWFEVLPPEIETSIAHKLYYGHFFCHVFHQDYIVAKGHDALEIEHHMWTLLDQRRAEYPAEHNVGHLYKAKPPLADFYRRLDPANGLNPGIGQTSKHRHWN